MDVGTCQLYLEYQWTLLESRCVNFKKNIGKKREEHRGENRQGEYIGKKTMKKFRENIGKSVRKSGRNSGRKAKQGTNQERYWSEDCRCLELSGMDGRMRILDVLGFKKESFL